MLVNLLNAQCPREQVILDYNNIYLPASFDLNELAWTGSTATCNPGTYAASVNQKMLTKINYFRNLCDLNDDVVFNSTLNASCQEAALMQEANNSLSHCTGTSNAPCNTWSCNTLNAISASGSSNLAWGTWNSFDPVDLYMLDSGGGNEAVGHRRWLLYSRAKTFGNGMTNNRNAMWVFGNNSNPAGNNRPYIAYPPGDYIVQDLVYPRWSFGVPGATFINATVTMTDDNGNNVPLNIIYNASVGFGDISVVWEPTGVVINDVVDRDYNVTVSNITGGPQSSYSYTVTIVPNVYPPNCLAGEVWNTTTCTCVPNVNCASTMNVNSSNISGVYEADNLITSNGQVQSGNTGTFESGNIICLEDGFVADANGNFNAFIIFNPCVNFNDPTPPSNLSEINGSTIPNVVKLAPPLIE